MAQRGMVKKMKTLRTKISSMFIALLMIIQILPGSLAFAGADTPNVYFSNYIPDLAFVSHFNGGLLLSWRNPSSATLSDVKLYDITGGKNELIDSEISTNALDRILYPVEGLTDRETYQYKMIFSFTDREDTVYYLTGAPEPITEGTGDKSKTVSVDDRIKNLNGWTGLIRNATYRSATNWTYEKKNPFKYSFDSNIKHGTSGSSLRLDSHAAISMGSSRNYTQSLVQSAKGFELDAGKTYRLSYWVKTRGVEQYLMSVNNQPFGGASNLVGPVKSTTDWTYVEQFFTTTTTLTKQQIMINGKYAGTVWIDDIKLCEVIASTNENNETVYTEVEGTDKVVNGTFDTNYVPVTLNGLIAAGSEEKVTFSWDSITPAGGAILDNNNTYVRSEYAGINIYELVGNAYEFRGTIASKENTITLPVTKTGTHNYKLVPLDVYGVEGTPNEVSVNVPVNTAIYQPKTPITRQFNGGLLLSWKNPSSMELNDVKVYDVTNGKSELIDDTIDATASKYILYEADGYDVGAKLFKVVFSFDNHDDVEYYFQGIVTADGIPEIDETLATNKQTNVMYKFIGDWSIHTANASHSPAAATNPTTYNRKMPLNYGLDTKNAYGGYGASLKFESNAIDYDDANAFSRIYAQAVLSGISFEAGKTYKLTFMAKSEDLDRVRILLNMDGLKQFTTGINAGHVAPIKGTTDWTQYEATYTATENLSGNLEIWADRTGTVWFDDISLYEWDTVNNQIAETAVNLIPGDSGTFNDLSAYDIGTLQSVTATSKDGIILIKSVGGDMNVDGINLYKEVDGKYEYRGTLSRYITDVNVEEIANADEIVKFKVVPVNMYGMEGEEYVVTYLPPVRTEFAHFADDVWTETTNVKAGTVKVTAKLPVRAEAYNMAFVVALYNGSRLVSVDVKEGQISADGTQKETEVTVPEFKEKDNYKIKVMYWNDMSSMVPVKREIITK